MFSLLLTCFTFLPVHAFSEMRNEVYLKQLDMCHSDLSKNSLYLHQLQLEVVRVGRGLSTSYVVWTLHVVEGT